jgi:peptidoglycan-associated lipoprotein
VAVALLLIVTSAACSRKPRPATPAPPEATPTSSTPAADGSSTSADGRAAEDARLREENARMRAILEQMVFFDYDRSEIRDDAKQALDAKVVVLRNHPDVRIRIDGHADERGSVEYNLALSLRRANSVKSYLESFGISPSNMEVLAFGEERPLEDGQSEAAYARNRRAEFAILAGLASR